MTDTETYAGHEHKNTGNSLPSPDGSVDIEIGLESSADERSQKSIEISFNDLGDSTTTHKGDMEEQVKDVVEPEVTFWELTFKGMKKNVVPGIVIVIFATIIVFGYYFNENVQDTLDKVARFKQKTGYVYSFFSTAFFGGLIPWIVITFKSRREDPNVSITSWLTKREIQVCLFYVIWLGLRGIEVDFLYRLQAEVWGHDNSITTIIPKVIIDQFVYNPFWGAPLNTIAFLWKDRYFSFEEVKKEMQNFKYFVTFRVASVLVTVWVIWIPVVCLVYALPSALQLPLQNLVLCFYVLLLTFVTARTLR
eukprot:TRINITY_DN1849_c0_g1_i2.p1 TRINITY_DN1849_c0_g1~~TRINITY_DN1849_c0_g1_i2.p1  ORF type:complete len:347 (+),score=51.67 TRINITY_DN1849_c0_g1_i2:123-1043(+)